MQLDAGDLLLFHANIKHSATANIGTRARLSMWSVYALPWMRVFTGYEFDAAYLDERQARSTTDLMRDINRAFEVAVRHDPANWFWVHNRWKLIKGRNAAGNESMKASGPGQAAAPISASKGEERLTHG